MAEMIVLQVRLGIPCAARDSLRDSMGVQGWAETFKRCRRSDGAAKTGYSLKGKDASRILIHSVGSNGVGTSLRSRQTAIKTQDQDLAMKITVETIVAAPIEKVWSAYTKPEDIQQWNAASDDWHTTAASVD